MSPTGPMKSVKIQLRLTPLERDQLDALAAKYQLTISEYIRRLIDREAHKLK